MEWNIEKSKKEDCKLIVEFITKVWSETYRGIINDNFLDSFLSSKYLIIGSTSHAKPSPTNNGKHIERIVPKILSIWVFSKKIKPKTTMPHRESINNIFNITLAV